jgi:CDGSH-type Zn-finger protein
MESDERKDLSEITIISDGPLKVSGNFTIKDSNQQILEVKDEVFLCRCGGSANKPFCDGTHKRIGVRD